jgi:TonB family protein
MQSVWKLAWVLLPATHAPIHLLDERHARIAPAAQLGSTLIHALVGVALVWMVAQPPERGPSHPPRRLSGPFPIPVPKWLTNADSDSRGKKGESGGHDRVPPSTGELAPPSRVALVSPRLSDSRPRLLSVPVTIADADASEFVRIVNSLARFLGIQRIGADTANHLRRHWRIGAVIVAHARITKLQGSVMLSVLVGADGRVKEVRAIRGLGMGLDENAIQAVRNWPFLPAKDAARALSRLGSKSKPCFGCSSQNCSVIKLSLPLRFVQATTHKNCISSLRPFVTMAS